jgi:hypothetical protein
MADLLPRIEPLLLKAEALDLVEVLTGFEGDHVVRRYTIDGPGKRFSNLGVVVGSLDLIFLATPVFCLSNNCYPSLLVLKGQDQENFGTVFFHFLNQSQYSALGFNVTPT